MSYDQKMSIKLDAYEHIGFLRGVLIAVPFHDTINSDAVVAAGEHLDELKACVGKLAPFEEPTQ